MAFKIRLIFQRVLGQIDVWNYKIGIGVAGGAHEDLYFNAARRPDLGQRRDQIDRWPRERVPLRIQNGDLFSARRYSYRPSRVTRLPELLIDRPKKFNRQFRMTITANVVDIFAG